MLKLPLTIQRGDGAHEFSDLLFHPMNEAKDIIWTKEDIEEIG